MMDDDDDDDERGAVGGMLGKILCDITWARTRTSAVVSQRLTA
jgi:hypothetical protein